MLNRVLITLVVILCVAIPRWYYVSTFAISLPFWDQWDAEGDYLLRPYMEGKLRLRELWQPHNEHRIFPTRLLSLLIFEITGEWNNLTEAFVNVFLAASIPAILVYTIHKHRDLAGFRWLFVPVLLAQFALPFSFENYLIGFQSQFYFLVLFTVSALIIAAYVPDNKFRIPGIITLCVLSVITMASGLLTPITIACVFCLDWYMNRNYPSRNVLSFGLLILIALFGFLILPATAGNEIYKSRDASEFLSAAAYMLSWPVVENKWASLLWLPGAVMILFLLLSKKMTRPDLLLAGCYIWSLCQAVAIAYGRGQNLTIISSRYTELLTIGIVSNAWFSVRFIEESGNRWYRWSFLPFFFIYFTTQKGRLKSDMLDVRKTHRYSIFQMENVTAYLETKDSAYLQKKEREIPFPDPVRLKLLLDNPTLQSTFPSPLRESLEKGHKKSAR
ncbi:hypothetical protein [Dyadobacter sp. CY323]|uniref:hypothetical protein n=1 Tax=Dyadobacter sp. CY323 TaxID=2907302 RepID=UPI001F209F87|nr:hypothetical protein [Dyadobacter sp. CY323]MCE6992159.1 hypothetical protein [Dyadobacter sp. CY323]